MQSNNLIQNFNYCMDLVKRTDYENYLCTLLAPSSVKELLFVLHAYNSILSQILEQTKIKETSLMRFKFWDETINRIFETDSCSRNPIARSLLNMNRKYKLDKTLLQGMITARQCSIGNPTFINLKNLEKYLEDVGTPIYSIPLNILCPNNDSNLKMSKHICKSIGMVNFVRSIPYHATRNSVLIPLDLLSQNNLTSNDVLSIWRTKESPIKTLTKKYPATNSILKNLSLVIEHNLYQARQLKHQIPSSAFSLFLCTDIIDTFLKRVKRNEYNFLDTLRMYELHGRNKLVRRNRNWLPARLLCRKLLKIY
ncbi:unnamed protein product [Gordionus sp. m RMFG-2023]